jgi:fumarylpyruvate hydrolase
VTRSEGSRRRRTNYSRHTTPSVTSAAPATTAGIATSDHVYGYACGLDMTRRDLQFAAREKQRPWDFGKDVEQSAVLGEIAPAAEIGHPHRGLIELRLNGQTKQSADLSLLIHGIPAVVAHLSQYYHLHAGDLIYTGTPEGVGPVQPGDRIEGSIEGVGTIALTIGKPA